MNTTTTEALHDLETDAAASQLDNDAVRRVEAARQLDLAWQSDHQSYVGRIAAAARTGLKRTSLQEAVSMMTNKQIGSLSTDNEDPTRQLPFRNPWAESSGVFASLMQAAWDFFSVTESDEAIEWCRWGKGFRIARQYVDVGGWFSHERFVVTRLDSLRASIPYGVMLRIEELRSAQLFDCFSVIAPESLVKRLPVAQLDPIVIGSIYNRSYIPTDHGDRGGEAHFVVAQWL